MKNLGIQRTILLAVLLPSVLIAIALTTYFTLDRIRDSENAWRMLGYNMARNLATSSEYAIVTGNRPLLDTLAHTAAKEPGVRFVVIRNEAGRPISWSGVIDPGVFAKQGEQSRVQLEAQWVISLPVELHSLNLQDPMLDIAQEQGASQPVKVIGTVLLGMSTDNLDKLRQDLLVAGLLIMGLGSVLAAVFAVVVSRTISRPILELSQVVGRLEEG
ncbi:MAG: hypothetical protein HXY26_10495, partial [Hydrogenophilaceae bacterium]|nr:hypothetical protein [Hydrogenophilaceae bacterium]